MVYWDSGRENGNYRGYSDSIGVYRDYMNMGYIYMGYMGIMEKNMETTIVYWGCLGDNGKENGHYYSMFLTGSYLG